MLLKTVDVIRSVSLFKTDDTFDTLNVTHGFSTRQGGLSQSPFDTLNLGFAAGDDQQTVLKNRQLFYDALGLSSSPKSVHQIHGNTVFVLEDNPDYLREFAPQADAIISNIPGSSIAVLTADCTPILLFDPLTGSIGAVHAGWRGTVQDIIGQTIRAMGDRYGVDPVNLHMSIGPCIQKNNFKIGPEVVEAFNRLDLTQTTVYHQSQWFGDLPLANNLLAQRAGVLAHKISDSGLCTYGEPELFFSYRRDGERSGRMQSVIVRPL
jgi:polyphenol oxidase